MSEVTSRKAYVFHTDLGTVVTELRVVARYDVEDIIRDRSVSQARSVQLLNESKRSSPNDPAAARTLGSVYTQSAEELSE
jgi:hypothetical protein